MVRLLNRKYVEWICNHHINASLLLQHLGVSSSKVIPYDFPHVFSSEFLPKTLHRGENPYQLLCIGSVTEAKGVGDAIRGLKLLIQKGFNVCLTIVGNGNLEYFSNLTNQLELNQVVHFKGAVKNTEVISLMNQSDIVLIPSRRSYPEGLPLTIFEALMSRTPIVASDHPMFQGHLDDGVGAVVFPSGNSIGLATAIERLLTDEVLYETLSLNAKQTWRNMQIATKIGDIWKAWLEDSPASKQWLWDHRLQSGQYRLPAQFSF